MTAWTTLATYRSNRPHVRSRVIGCSILATAWLLLIPGTAYAAPGDLDLAFGEGGWAFTQVSGYAGTNAAALQPDDKIVVVATSGEAMKVWRLLPAGSPDPSFGGDGEVALVFPQKSAALSVAVRPDGTILLAGQIGRRIALVRLLPNGEPDMTFGDGDGLFTILLAEPARAEDLVLLPDGGTLVGAALLGRFQRAVGTALIRLTPSGTLVESFGIGGIVIDPRHVFGDLTIDEQDTIVVGMSALWFQSKRFFLAHYDVDGSPDPAFGGGDGIRRFEVKGTRFPNEIIVDEAGNLLVLLTGLGNRCIFETGAVIRLTPERELDPGFSDDGVVRNCTLMRRIVLQGDGRILVAGSIFAGAGSGEYQPTITRLTTDGDLDLSFGDGGTVFAPPGGYDASYWSGARGLLLQSDGKIVLVAGAVYDSGFAVGRFLAG